MSAFFNGRVYTTPAVASAVNDSALANQNLGVGNVLALIGHSQGGAPATAMRFSNPSDALAALISGDLCDMVVKAFAPSNDPDLGAPSTVIALRVDPATKSTLTLLDATTAASIVLSSADYGAYTTGIHAKGVAGSVSGLQPTITFGSTIYTADNVGQQSFSLQYSGAAVTATIDVSANQIVLYAPAASPVATIDLTMVKTVQDVVDRINAVADFSATLIDANGSAPTLNSFDFVTAHDCKTSAYTVTSNLQATINWFNTQAGGRVTAARATGAGLPPAPFVDTYLTGGSDGTTTNTEWSNCFTALQLEKDVRWITPLSSDTSIHAMTEAHVAYMSTAGQSERRAIVGGATAESQATAIAAAKALNCDRVGRVYGGYYDYDVNGTLVLLPPYKLAAIMSAAFSGSSPGTALTNKSLAISGLEYRIKNPADTDVLIPAGLICMEDTQSGFLVVQSVSTWLANDNYNRVELSVGAALDYAVLNWRSAVAGLKGQRGDSTLISRALSQSDTVLRQLSTPLPNGPGVLVGDSNNPPFKNITTTLVGDVLTIQAQVSPVIPANYIFISVAAVPFSATATATA